MNVNDTEVVWSILKSKGFAKTDDIHTADIILVMTCAIREGAETKIWNKLKYCRGLKNVRSKFKEKIPIKIGVLGN
jgi:tRNA A37 methylthiotransferase MiaB